MKNKTVTFYTQKEIETIEKYVKNGKSVKLNVEDLSNKLKRPMTGIYAKYLQTKNRLGLSKKTEIKIRKEMKETKTVVFPTDATIEFSAKRVLVQDGKVIIYFK
jgi:hypothetical protein